MKQGSTLFLKAVVVLVGLMVILLCLLWLPWLAGRYAATNPELASLQYPVLIGLYATAVPFFFALVQAFKLLTYIDRDQAFSELSVKAVKHIKYAAVTISILYAFGMPLLIMIAAEDDAPGVAAAGVVMAFASIVVAVFAAVIQKLLRNAIELKSENDLTI